VEVFFLENKGEEEEEEEEEEEASKNAEDASEDLEAPVPAVCIMPVSP
jgi:hypothetical protein